MEANSKNYTNVDIAKVSAFGAENIYRVTFTLSLVGVVAWLNNVRQFSSGNLRVNLSSLFPKGMVMNWIYLTSPGFDNLTDWISFDNMTMEMQVSSNAGALLSQPIQGGLTTTLYSNADQTNCRYLINNKVILPFNMVFPGAILDFSNFGADVRCGSSGTNTQLPNVEILMSLTML